MSRRSTHDGSAQDGSATVLVLAVASALLAAGVVGSAVGGAVLLRHRAASAADAAALAAAMRADAGPGAACARGAALARANGGRLVSCSVHGPVADVSVAVSAGGWLSWLPAVRLNARAGPAETYREEPAPLDRAS
jgi:secretion/DNA translocation related TadE-like protein